MTMLHGTKTHRAVVRGGAALALLAVLGLGGCAGSRSGTMDGGAAGSSGRDDEKARCERDHGVWRPEIAGGYCERKP